MKFIELYGFSCSGKSFLAKEICSKEKIDSSFLIISKKNRVIRLLQKIIHLRYLNIEDLKFISNLHKNFKFINFKYKLKNYFSFLYLIGFIRKNIRFNKSIIIDHGIFQCLFSCYIYSYNDLDNNKEILLILKNYFSKISIKCHYQIICVNTDLKIVKSRLKDTKNYSNLLFLEENIERVKNTYQQIEQICNQLSNEYIDFESF